MEVSLGKKQKQKQEQFTALSVSNLSSPSSSPSSVVARFSSESGVAQLRFHRESDGSSIVDFDLGTTQLFKLGPLDSVCMSQSLGTANEKTYSRGVTIQFKNEEESTAFHCTFEEWKKGPVVQEKTEILRAIGLLIDYKGVL